MLSIEQRNDLAEHWFEELYKVIKVMKYANNNYISDSKNRMSMINIVSSLIKQQSPSIVSNNA